MAQDEGSTGDFGVLVYANGLLHAGRQVLSANASHSGSFRSHPGPVGELRGGQTVSTSVTIARRMPRVMSVRGHGCTAIRLQMQCWLCALHRHISTARVVSWPTGYGLVKQIVHGWPCAAKPFAEPYPG